MWRAIVPWLLALAFAACAGNQKPASSGVAAAASVPGVPPVAETEPVASAEDAADDPAIWIHPTDPAQSLVLGTDKQRGLHVYNLDGRVLQTLPDGRLNNVDLRDGFVVKGREYALVAASNRTDRSIALYLLDPDTRRLERAAPPVPTGLAEPYGTCMYKSSDGRFFVFVNEADTGRFRQWEVRDEAGAVRATRARQFVVGGQAEGCVADDESGALYVAEENSALWRYEAMPDRGNARRQVDRVGHNGLVADLEGVAIWQGRHGGGYVVLSNQGANRYALYRRDGGNEFVGQFQVTDNEAAGFDGVSETDGLAVTSQPLGPKYSEGLLVVQDGSNEPPGEHQNFKLVSWRDVREALGLKQAD